MKMKQLKDFLAVAVILLASSMSATAGGATPQEVFDSMRANFRADKAAGLNARYQFEISGARGGTWAVEVKNGRCHFQKAKIEKPDVTLTVSDKDWVALANGRLNGVWAFVTGRLKIRGDQNVARKLDELFP